MTNTDETLYLTLLGKAAFTPILDRSTGTIDQKRTTIPFLFAQEKAASSFQTSNMTISGTLITANQADRAIDIDKYVTLAAAFSGVQSRLCWAPYPGRGFPCKQGPELNLGRARWLGEVTGGCYVTLMFEILPSVLSDVIMPPDPPEMTIELTIQLFGTPWRMKADK